MTLPYRSNQPRKYRCFICGVDYLEYDDFKQHIIDEHEEGKEYVVCKTCGAPVRDMKLHYKVKHPGKQMPKEGQTRAIVWYDFSGQKRKRDKKQPNYKKGYHSSAKTNFQPQHHDSGYELEVFQILDELNEVVSYEAEPSDCVTQYYWSDLNRPADNMYRKYFPDLKVKFVDGHIEVWEIKPSDQTDLPQNQAKWNAAAEQMRHRGWDFKVKTEQGIDKLRKMLYQQKKKKK